MIGTRFGRWLVEEQGESRYYLRSDTGRLKEVRFWVCLCGCGVRRPVNEPTLIRGASVSCGCYQKEVVTAVHVRHGGILGGKATTEYSCWRAMMSRCYNLNNSRYKDYGGRGIKVTGYWKGLLGFQHFFGNMGYRPSSKHTLDRKDNDGNYTVDNTQWSLPHDQMVNRRNSLYYEWEGKMVPLSELAVRYGIPANTLRFRLQSWDIADALNVPVRPKALRSDPLTV